MQGPSKALTISDRIYCLLLFAYPASFRREYGVHMAQVFRDRCRARLESQGLAVLSLIWFQVLYDWLKTVFEQHIEEAFHMSGQKWIVRLASLAALAGGILGLYLLTKGPNTYGNYGWNNWLAPVIPILLVLGLGGAIVAHQTTLNTTQSKMGIYITIAGLLLLGIGYAFDALWFFIFFGPLIIVPIGTIMLGFSIYQRVSLPTWWRFFPFLIGAIALFGFGIELFEEFIGNSTPDRGVQFAEALFSLAWIGLGIGLWLDQQPRPDDPGLVA